MVNVDGDPSVSLLNLRKLVRQAHVAQFAMFF